MKRKLVSFMLCILLCIFIGFFVSCGKEECEHNWANEVVKTEATCQSEGEAEYTCTKCKKTKTTTIEKTDHKKSTDFKYDADCHFFYCTVCDTALEKESHKLIDGKIIVPATAYEPGVIETKCSSCAYTSTRLLDTIPHEKDSKKSFDEEYHWYKCIAHEECSVVIQKTKHTIVEGEILKEPSEEEDGLQRIYCTDCDFEKNVILPSFKHIKGEIDFDDTSHWYTCSKHENCGVKYDQAAHDWIEKEREEATCTEKGSISYKCSVCDATKTEDIQPHHSLRDYPEKKPTCEDEGWNAYVACTKCDYTTKQIVNALGHSFTLIHTDPSGHYQGCIRCNEKTSEVIEHTYTIWKTTTPATLYTNGFETKSCECGYLGLETREVNAQADFKNDFSLNDSNGLWKYGSIDYKWSEENFDFAPLTNKTESNDGWVADGIEIKAGWINAGSMMGIAYTISEDIYAGVRIRFVGGTDLTRLALRVGVKNNEGVLYENPSFHSSDNNTLEVVLEFNFKSGDTIYFIFSNETNVEGAFPNGKLNINLKKCIDFRNDFSIEESNGLWKYGSIDYKWSEENFDFTPLTNKTESNDGWVADGIEIKAGWINAGSMMGIAYTVTKAMSTKIKVKMIGGTDLTRLALRVGVKNNEGTLYENPSFHASDNKTLEVVLEFDFKVGDTIYFIFSNEASSVEGAYPNASLDITIF